MRSSSWRKLAVFLAAVVLLGGDLGCGSAPQRFAKHSSDFLSRIDPYEARCVEVEAKECDCAAYTAALEHFQAALVAYYEHNVSLRVSGGVGWQRVKDAAKAAEKAAACGG